MTVPGPVATRSGRTAWLADGDSGVVSWLDRLICGV